MLLHRLPPERAHSLTVRAAQAAGAVAALGWMANKVWGVPSYPVTAMGLQFSNRVGIAAGFDKDAIGYRGLARVGVGHVEVGTVTLRPQPGNDRPRVFRLPEDQSVINRMGFPSRGADFVLRRLRPVSTVLGVNIGKAKDTPLSDAADEYAELASRFAPLADYLAVNVSSPNTPELRKLQGADYLRELLVATRDRAGDTPVVAKLSPDLDDQGLDDALAAITDAGIDGVIATNTTVSRPSLRSPHGDEAGGLSGAALTEQSTQQVTEIAKRTGGTLPIIAAGGVMKAGDAVAKLEAGATLIQVYTGLIYRGPALLREIAEAVR